MLRSAAALGAAVLLLTTAVLWADDTSFQVSDVASGNGCSYVRVAVNAAGDALIVWREFTEEDYLHFPIRCRLASRQADGTYVPGEVRTIVTESQSVNLDFDIATQVNGKGFILVWVGVTNLGESDGSTQIYCRTVSADGAKFGPLRMLYSNEFGTPGYPVIAADPLTGGFLVLFNYYTLPGHSPGIYGVRLDRKGRPKGIVFRVWQADVADGKAASHLMQNLNACDDGSFLASALAVFPGFHYKSLVVRIPAGPGSATSTYLQQSESLLIDAVQVGANRAVAVGSVNRDQTGRSSYAPLKLPKLRAKKAKLIVDPGTVSGAKLLGIPGGGAWLIHFTVNGQYRAQRINDKGVFQGGPINLLESTFVSDYRSAALIPGTDEVFIAFTRLIDGTYNAFAASAPLTP